MKGYCNGWKCKHHKCTMSGGYYFPGTPKACTQMKDEVTAAIIFQHVHNEAVK